MAEEEDYGFDNPSGLKFNDVSDEEWREYTFPDGTTVRIDGHTHLNVSASGGHRVFHGKSDQTFSYIPSGWVQLNWSAKKNGRPIIAF